MTKTCELSNVNIQPYGIVHGISRITYRTEVTLYDYELCHTKQVLSVHKCISNISGHHSII